MPRADLRALGNRGFRFLDDRKANTRNSRFCPKRHNCRIHTTPRGGRFGHRLPTISHQPDVQMAEVIWAEPALHDLDAIADYIALDNPEAARGWCRKTSSMSISLKVTLDLAQSRKNSRAGVTARSSSRRVASSTAKILDEY
jgi:plasmid stabilization system protein ParE